MYGITTTYQEGLGARPSFMRVYPKTRAEYLRYRSMSGVKWVTKESWEQAKYQWEVRKRIPNYEQLEEAGFGQQPVPPPSKQYYEEEQRRFLVGAGQQPAPIPPEYQKEQQRLFMEGLGKTPIPYGEPEYMRYAGQYPQYIPPPPRPPSDYKPREYRIGWTSDPKYLTESDLQKRVLKEALEPYPSGLPLMGGKITYEGIKDYIGKTPTEIYLIKAQQAKAVSPLLSLPFEFTAGAIAPFETALSLIPYQTTFKYQPTPVGAVFSEITEREGRPTQTAYIFSYKTEVPQPMTSQEAKYLVEHPTYAVGSFVGEIALSVGVGKAVESGAKLVAPTLRRVGLFKMKAPKPIPVKPSRGLFRRTEFYGYRPTKATQELAIIQKGRSIYETSFMDISLKKVPISYEDYLKLSKVRPKTLEIRGGEFTAVSTPKGEVAYPKYFSGYQRADQALEFIKEAKVGHRARYFTFAKEAYPETGFMKGYKFFDERISRATQTAYASTYPSDIPASYLVKGDRGLLTKIGRPPLKESVERFYKLKRTRKGVKVDSVARRTTEEADPYAIFGKRKVRIDRIWGQPLEDLTPSGTGFKPSTVKPKPSKPTKGKPFTYLGRWGELRKAPLKVATKTKMDTPLPKGTGSVEQTYLGAEAVTKPRPTTYLTLGTSVKTASQYGYGRVPISKTKRKTPLLQVPKFQPTVKQGLIEIPAFELTTKTQAVPRPKLGDPLKFIPQEGLNLDRVPWQTPKPTQTPQLKIPVPQKTTDEVVPLFAIPARTTSKPARTVLPEYKPTRRGKRTKKPRGKGYRLKIHPVGEIEL